MTIKTVALVAHPGCSLLELIGAQCVWATAARMSTLKPTVVGPTRGFTPSSTSLTFAPQATFDDLPSPDVLFVVGGGPGEGAAPDDPGLLNYVRAAGQQAAIVAASGTGSLILAAAGLLDGRAATTRWGHGPELEARGVRYRQRSIVEDGTVATGAGTSAAIDLSLLLLARVRSPRLARRVQVIMEYDPQPPWGPLDPAALDGAGPPQPGSGREADRQVTCVIYEGLTVLDLVGPLEVLTALAHRLGHRPPVVAAASVAPVTSDSGVTFMPTGSFDDYPAPEVLVVPGGGLPTLRAMGDAELRRYLQAAATTASRTASVCTGALLLASVGLLRGREATTHWAYRAYLPAFGARYVQRRWVDHGDLITSAGVSAGIDMALQLAAELSNDDSARRVQLDVHYDPHPPLGGIDYDELSPALRALRRVIDLSVPVFSRKPHRMARQPPVGSAPGSGGR